jgi:hypothetical protein
MKAAPILIKHRDSLISGVVSLMLMAGILAALIISGILFTANRDERIESAARKSIALKNDLHGADIQIHSQDGVITLTGTVFAQPDLSWAADTVAALPGVKRVDNRLAVKREGPGTELATPVFSGSKPYILNK